MNHALETPEKKSRSSTVLVWLIGFCMLCSLERLFNHPVSEYVYSWVLLLQTVLLGTVLSKIRLKGHAWYWISAAGFVWLIVSNALESEKALKYMDPYILRAILIYLLCPAVGLLAAEGDLKHFLKVFIGIWTLFYTVLSIIGIYLVYKGTYVLDFSGQYYLGLGQKIDGVLILWDNQQNETSSNLVFSIMMAAIGFALYKSKAVKTSFVIATIPMFIAIAMTGSRAGQISLGMGLGFVVAIVLQKLFLQKHFVIWLRLIISIAVVMIVTVAIIGIFMGTQQLINRVISKQFANGIMPSARAEVVLLEEEEKDNYLGDNNVQEEESTPELIRERAFLQNDFLMGRQLPWRQTIQAIEKAPSLLIRGGSVPYWREKVKKMGINFWNYHCHNIFLQFVMEAGLPAFLLSLVYVFYVIRAAVKLFFNTEHSLWHRFLILPIVTIAIIEMVESIFRIRSKAFSNQTFMLFTGLILALTSVHSHEREKQ